MKRRAWGEEIGRDFDAYGANGGREEGLGGAGMGRTPRGRTPQAVRRCNVNESEFILMIDKNGRLLGENGRWGGLICAERCIFAEKQHLS